jgi:hypothetical protein
MGFQRIYLSASSTKRETKSLYVTEVFINLIENVAKFGFLGTAITKKKYIFVVVKKSSDSENGCSLSVKNLFSFHLISENVTTTAYKSVILLNVLYGFESRFLTVKEQHRLNVHEDRTLRRISGPKRGEMIRGLRK